MRYGTNTPPLFWVAKIKDFANGNVRCIIIMGVCYSI